MYQAYHDSLICVSGSAISSLILRSLITKIVIIHLCEQAAFSYRVFREEVMTAIQNEASINPALNDHLLPMEGWPLTVDSADAYPEPKCAS